MATENDDTTPLPPHPVESTRPVEPTPGGRTAATAFDPNAVPQQPPAAETLPIANPTAAADPRPNAYATPNPYVYSPAAVGSPQGLSVASMVCGITGIVASFALLGLLPALAAVITGHLAARRQPLARPFWLTGLITGYVGLAISLLTILAVVIPLILAFTFWNSGEMMDPRF